MLGSHGEGYFTSRRDGEREGIGVGGKRVCVWRGGGETWRGDIYDISFKGLFHERPPSFN